MQSSTETLGILGTGYVGLVAAACFASKGHKVICYDIDALKLEKLQRGEVPFFEPGLEKLLIQHSHLLRWTCNLDLLLEECDLLFLCLPTPQRADGSCDLSALFSVTKLLADRTQKPLTLINKSTAPVGTARQLEEIGKGQLQLVSNPEFLKEGGAIEDFLHPERILIGLENTQLKPLFQDLYASFRAPIQWMNFESAELAKYASNAMLACRISFMNELARLAEKTGADIDKIRLAMGADGRIGPAFLHAGVGFGGSCFPKDLAALSKMFQKEGLEGSVVGATLSANQRQKAYFFEKIEARFPEGLFEKRIAIWGLSFKPGTDDIREAPALYFIEKLLSAGATVTAFDPIAMERVAKIFPDILYAESPEEAAVDADAIILLTEWPDFLKIDLSNIARSMAAPRFFDGRGTFDPLTLQRLGFEYVGIGKGEITIEQHA